MSSSADDLEDYFLVDQDPRMKVVEKLNANGSFNPAVAILRYLLKVLGVSDEFIARMTSIEIYSMGDEEEDPDECEEDEEEDPDECEENMEPAKAKLFLLIGDLLLKDQETTGIVSKMWEYTLDSTKEEAVSADDRNRMTFILAVAFQCIEYSQRSIERFIASDCYKTKYTEAKQMQIGLDFAMTYSRIGDVRYYRQDCRRAIDSYNKSIELRRSVTGKDIKLLAMDHYRISICYETEYKESLDACNSSQTVRRKAERGDMAVVDEWNKLSASDFLYFTIVHSFASAVAFAQYYAGCCDGVEDCDIDELNKALIEGEGVDFYYQKMKYIEQIMNKWKPAPGFESEFPIILQFITELSFRTMSCTWGGKGLT
jgi:hypothetical protein